MRASKHNLTLPSFLITTTKGLEYGDTAVSYTHLDVYKRQFMKLPSRRELPDYYDVIKKPLDIKKIMTRIEEGKVG